MEINEEEYRWHGLKGEIFIAGARITISIRTHVVHTHTHSESIPHHLTSRNTPAPCRIRDPIFVTRLSIHSPVQHVSQDVWTLESASSRVAINKPQASRTRAPLEMHPVKLEQPLFSSTCRASTSSFSLLPFFFPPTSMLSRLDQLLPPKKLEDFAARMGSHL